MPHSQVIATDPCYRIRDNQFWYSDCTFKDLIINAARITIRIKELGELTLTHAKQGTDGRPTYSFRLPGDEEKKWWKENRGKHVRVELLNIDDFPDVQEADSSHQPLSDPISDPCTLSDFTGDVLCVGLDIAWFGGAANNPDSQYDCLGYACLNYDSDQSVQPIFGLERIQLPERDPKAIALFQSISKLLERFSSIEKIILAIDAPLQAKDRPQLPERRPVARRGEVERRACENYFSQKRQEMDGQAGGANGWQPNIQPGAPLAPRVKHLLMGLKQQGFSLWTKDENKYEKQIIECFPAGAIWALKRIGKQYTDKTASQVKAYKNQQGKELSAQEVGELVHIVLDDFQIVIGGDKFWSKMVDHTINWLIQDPTWRNENGLFRGGKLLDDVVDTMICLATALSYKNNQFHVWYDENHPDDGHIVTPCSL